MLILQERLRPKPSNSPRIGLMVRDVLAIPFQILDRWQLRHSFRRSIIVVRPDFSLSGLAHVPCSILNNTPLHHSQPIERVEQALDANHDRRQLFLDLVQRRRII
jgi:hypothetical protein